ELTEMVDEDGSVRRVTPLADKPQAASGGREGSGDPPQAGEAAGAEPPSASTASAAEPRLELPRERILSTATSGAAAAAFAQLGVLPRERRRESELPLGGADRTLEDVVRDLLRPLLQTWLDENLPTLVERLVREEI